MNIDYAKPRTLEEGSFLSDAENIMHLEQCPDCAVCQHLIQFYQACDNCGEWGHSSAIKGIVQGMTTTVLCAFCLQKYEDDPSSVYLVPETIPNLRT